MTLRKSTTFRAEALILRRHDLGEADRTVTMYTCEHGKRRAVAKSVRRPQSRLAGHIELFTRAEVFVVVGSNLDVLTQARALEVFPALARDLERFARASWAAEVVDKLTPEGEPAPELFALLLATIRLLAEAEGGGGLHLRHFELLALDRLGYRPHLESCVNCGGELEERPHKFSPEAGGVACPDCARRVEGVTISAPALKVMRWLGTQPMGEAARLRSSPSLEAELERVSLAHLEFLLQRGLKSADLLARVRSRSRSAAAAG